ncbi:hypothetical protein [Streptomyces sp. NBC_01506]|uniref:hypothetical protein n=1 Tax=Streptomyces sp. NBC_01506 TaxID=2903887 RepID=UPI00386DA746
MRVYAGGPEGFSAFDGAAPEDFLDLFLGESGESEEQRAAREMAARDVLAELIDRSDDDECAMLNALYAAQLMAVVRLSRRANNPCPSSMVRRAA